MADWDPTSPHSWARRFGMVSVPAFGSDRAKSLPGNHSVLLDGSNASFFLSCGPSGELLSPSLVPCWSWSSNVNHAIIVDVQQGHLFMIRWDTLSSPSTLAIPDAESAASLISEIESAEPPQGESSIEKAIGVFRTVRSEIASFGGNDSDAVIVFNTILEWIESGHKSKVTTAEAILLLHQAGKAAHSVDDLSSKIAAFPLGELASLLSSTDPHGYVLDTDLLVRHASGTLFQEAHIEISDRRAIQPKLFVSAPDALSKPVGKPPSDIHFTPPSLARLLVQEAIIEHQRINEVSPKVLTVLDPACGSGVFLIESLREVSGTSHRLTLRGFDSSPIARHLAEFSIHRAISDSDAQVELYDVQKVDSLSAASWGDPDLILMNPPFRSWRLIDASTQDTIRDVLGGLYVGQSDTAIAFVAKAIQQLKPGSVLATVVPASFFVSRAAQRLRMLIYENPVLSVAALGRFRGYGYFHDAAVEPGFLVVSHLRSALQAQSHVKVTLAEPGHEDRAIRATRLLSRSEAEIGAAWEASLRPVDFLSDSDWMPRSEKAHRLLERMRDHGVKFVTELFDVHLGIRPGLKDVFLISKGEYEGLHQSEAELFRPTADSIRNCSIQESEYLFFPYDQHGDLVCSDENQLAQIAPWFYHQRLQPKKAELQSRGSLRGREWWELVEPRPTWMPKSEARIVSTQFARTGLFAFDRKGEYAVVNGNAWIWKTGAISEHDWWAYLAIVNSTEFESFLDYFCRRIPGPRFEVARRYLKQVPLPDVTALGRRLRDKLSRIGRGLFDRGETSLLNLSVAVAAAYRIDRSEFRIAFPPLEDRHLEEQFQILAAKWKKETGHHSSLAKRMKHPAFKQIMAMDQEAIPFILRDLKRRPQLWFNALESLTNEDPVPDDKRSDPIAAKEAWLEWANSKGFKL